MKLWTGTHGAGEITFVVSIDGTKVWEVDLGRGTETSKWFYYPAGPGTKTVTVTTDGTEIGTEQVDMDVCGPTPTPPTPGQSSPACALREAARPSPSR